MKKNTNGRTDEAIIALNSNKSNWTLTEYVDHYVKKGYPVYELVHKCHEQYPFINKSVAVCFVSNATHGEPTTIKNGKLKKGKIPYTVFGDTLLDFKEIFADYNHIFFIRALIYVIRWGYYDHKKDFKKITKNRYELIGCANLIQYITMFEKILNRNRHGGKFHIVTEYPRVK
jgi:hypothetical protein